MNQLAHRIPRDRRVGAGEDGLRPRTVVPWGWLVPKDVPNKVEWEDAHRTTAEGENSYSKTITTRSECHRSDTGVVGGQC